MSRARPLSNEHPVAEGDDDDVARRAALTAIERARYRNDMSLGDVLEEITQRSDLWEPLSRVGLVDFALALCGRYLARADREARGTASAPQGRAGSRTRLTVEQKAGLKELIMGLLQEAPAGMSRHILAERIPDLALAHLRLSPQRLIHKLRQPLAELTREGRIRGQGLKRNLVYVLARAGAPRRSGPQPDQLSA